MKFGTFHFVTFILAFLIIVSCQPPEYEDNFSLPDTLFSKHAKFTEINLIEANESKVKTVEDLASEINFIPLETSEESFYKFIDGIFINDTSIVLNTRKSVVFFDRNGNHKYTFQNLGRGPSEFITIYGFSLSFDGNRMAIADLQFIKLYDLKGRFIKAIKLPEMPFALSPVINFLNPKELLIENSRIKPEYDQFSPLWLINLSTNENKPLFENYPDSVAKFMQKYTFKGTLYDYQKSVRYQSRDSYNIYDISQQGDITLRYTMNFKDKSMPLGAVHNANRYREYREVYAEIYEITESTNYLFIKYGINQKPAILIFDKSQGKTIYHKKNIEGLKSDQYGELEFWPITTTEDGKLVCIHSASSIAKSDALEGVVENDNAVISIIDFKN